MIEALSNCPDFSARRLRLSLCLKAAHLWLTTLSPDSEMSAHDSYLKIIIVRFAYGYSVSTISLVPID